MPHIRIFTTHYCYYCVAARRELKRQGLAYEEIDVSADPAARAWLVQATGLRTVPQIFVGETPVGGFTDLIAAEKSGRWADLLAGR